jgi:hypothetical protein
MFRRFAQQAVLIMSPVLPTHAGAHLVLVHFDFRYILSDKENGPEFSKNSVHLHRSEATRNELMSLVSNEPRG